VRQPRPGRSARLGQGCLSPPQPTGIHVQQRTQRRRPGNGCTAEYGAGTWYPHNLVPARVGFRLDGIPSSAEQLAQVEPTGGSAGACQPMLLPRRSSPQASPRRRFVSCPRPRPSRLTPPIAQPASSTNPGALSRCRPTRSPPRTSELLDGDAPGARCPIPAIVALCRPASGTTSCGDGPLQQTRPARRRSGRPGSVPPQRRAMQHIVHRAVPDPANPMENVRPPQTAVIARAIQCESTIAPAPPEVSSANLSIRPPCRVRFRDISFWASTQVRWIHQS